MNTLAFPATGELGAFNLPTSGATAASPFFKEWDNDFSIIKDDITVKAIYETEGDFEMEDVNYWLLMLSKKYDIEEEILTKEEIAKYNEKIFKKR